MTALKFLSVILAQWMLIQEGYSLNVTGNTNPNVTIIQNLTTPTETSTSSGPTTVLINTTQTIIPGTNESSTQNGSIAKSPPDKDITETIFYNETSGSSTPNSNANSTFGERISNETLTTNSSMVAEAMAAPETIPPTFRLQKSAAIAAGVFLVSAVIGYMGCVGYRRYLQRKYGESQVISREDVYDTSDLRYFEI